MTRSQFRRQAWAIAGYFRPQKPASKVLERGFAGLGVCGPVDHAQRGHDGFSILPGDEFQRVPDQMHDGVVEKPAFA